jgi:hypothetical protein
MEDSHIFFYLQLTVKNFPGYDLLQLIPLTIITAFEINLASVNVTIALKLQ